MAESALTRLIVCVDESEYGEDGTLGAQPPLHGQETTPDGPRIWQCQQPLQAEGPDRYRASSRSSKSLR